MPKPIPKFPFISEEFMVALRHRLQPSAFDVTKVNRDVLVADRVRQEVIEMLEQERERQKTPD